MFPLEAPPVPKRVVGSLSGAPILMGMPIKRDDLTATHLERALGGDEMALGDLIDRMTPIIQVRAARAILRRQRFADRFRLRQEIEDLVQDVLVSLFANSARVLRNWDHDKGLSLLNYVGLVAERLVSSILQSGKKTWPTELVSTQVLDRPTTERDPEQQTTARQTLHWLLGKLQQDLSPQGFEMFRLLFVDDLSVGEIRQQTGLSDDAIYAWRSRLRRTTRRLMRRSEVAPTTAPSALDTGKRES